MIKIPEKAVDLIQELDKSFPVRLPADINFNEKEVAFIMGQRSVIDHLLYVLNNQNDGEIDNVLR